MSISWEELLRKASSSDEDKRRIALIDAMARLDKTLKQRGYNGKGVQDSMFLAAEKAAFPNLRELLEANKFRNRVAHDEEAPSPSRARKFVEAVRSFVESDAIATKPAEKPPEKPKPAPVVVAEKPKPPPRPTPEQIQREQAQKQRDTTIRNAKRDGLVNRQIAALLLTDDHKKFYQLLELVLPMSQSDYEKSLVRNFYFRGISQKDIRDGLDYYANGLGLAMFEGFVRPPAERKHKILRIISDCFDPPSAKEKERDPYWLVSDFFGHDIEYEDYERHVLGIIDVIPHGGDVDFVAYKLLYEALPIQASYFRDFQSVFDKVDDKEKALDTLDEALAIVVRDIDSRIHTERWGMALMFEENRHHPFEAIVKHGKIRDTITAMQVIERLYLECCRLCLV